ncbi:MAG: ABC transporter permease [Bacteroidota bacterium]
MLKNYLIVALRTLRKRPGYTLLNVGGLGLGLACCFLIVLFLQHERSVDRFHEHADRIVRLTYADAEGRYANTAAGFAPLVAASFPEVEQAVRLENYRGPFVRLPGGAVRKLSGLALADSGFFQTFSFDLLQGDPATVLGEPYGLVLTESMAEAFFGETNPVGQALQYDAHTLTVTGVMADVPANSSFTFNAVGSFLLLEAIVGEGALTDFSNYNFSTYLLLQPGVDRAALDAKMTTAMREQAFGEPEGEAAMGYAVALQPLADIYFNTGLTYDFSNAHRDASYLWTFGAVGLLILLIACVNFMNLATARAGQRAREVGVRKAVGAYRRQLAGQFLGESVLLSGLAIVLAVALASVALPFFSEAIGATVTFDPGQVWTVLLLVGIGLGAGLVAGSYPALYLSAFRPARVLKGETGPRGGALWLRKGLIVFQFAISAFLLVATLTIYDQLRFMQSRDLGFEKEQVLFVRPPAPVWDTFDAFAQELQASPRVMHVAKAGGLPGRVGTTRGYHWPGQAGEGEQGEGFATAPAGPGYLDVFGIDLVAGRGFSDDVPSDTLDAYILNETALATLGLTPEEAVGAPFRAWERPVGQIIGVVEDFHFQSLHEEVEPLVLNYIPWFSYAAMRVGPADLPATLNHVRATWETFAPGYAFDYTFLDEDFDRLYRAEARLGQLFGFFAGVAVFIACLGLLGLAAYAAARRRKEIGVRKVLGASAGQIATLLAGDFVRLVLAGLGIAVPLAWLGMGRWLEGFAYRVELGPGVFLLAGGIALAVALLTVSTQALRAATANPVQSLRNE